MSAKKHEYHYSVILFGVTLLSLIILYLFKDQNTNSQSKEQVWQVQAQQAQLQQNTPFITLHGTTETTQLASIKAAFTTDVLDTYVEEGQLVQKGQKLLKLDCRPPSLELEKLQNQYDHLTHEKDQQNNELKAAKTSLEHEKALLLLIEKAIKRQKDLFKKTYGSEAAFDQEQQRYHEQSLKITSTQLSIENLASRIEQINTEQAENKHQQEIVQIEIEHCIPLAPFKGYILGRNASKGNRVNRDDQMISMFDPSALQVKAFLPDRYLEQTLHAYQSHTLNAVNERNETYQVRAFDHDSSGTQGSTEIIFVPKEVNPSPILGRVITLYLLLTPVPNSFVIPTRAIYQNKRIYRIEHGVLHSAAANVVGEAWLPHKDPTTSFHVVTSPSIKSGDLIMTTPIPQARDGLKVTVHYAKT